jgi:hypothetical protein
VQNNGSPELSYKRYLCLEQLRVRAELENSVYDFEQLGVRAEIKNNSYDWNNCELEVLLLWQ